MIDNTMKPKFNKVNRVEVIGPGGREFVQYYADSGVYVTVQDDGCTLKVFVGAKEGK